MTVLRIILFLISFSSAQFPVGPTIPGTNPFISQFPVLPFPVPVAYPQQFDDYDYGTTDVIILTEGVDSDISSVPVMFILELLILSLLFGFINNNNMMDMPEATAVAAGAAAGTMMMMMVPMMMTGGDMPITNVRGPRVDPGVRRPPPPPPPRRR